MTTPQADGADRIPGVAQRQSSSGAAVGSLAVVLLVGLLLRLTIAYVLLPGSGFESDIATFTAWAFQLGQQGPGDFYATTAFADYPPGYLYVLWLIGGLGELLAPLSAGGAAAVTGALIKIPPILADVAIGALLFYLVRSWLGRGPRAHRLGVIAAAIYLFNPVTWYDSAIWGQTDSVGALVLLATVAALARGNSEGASALAVIAALIKPQFGVVALPLVGIVLLRRHLLRPGSGPRLPVMLPPRVSGWFETEHGPWRVVSSAVTALIVTLALLAPFSLDLLGFIRQMVATAGGYPWLSVNAYNPWALFGSDGAQPLLFTGGWSSDVVGLLGPLPGVVIGGALLAGGFAIGLIRLAWSDDRRSIVLVTTFLALAFFILPTRVHERYMFPIFALLPLLAVVDRRWLWATVALSAAAFINLHGVLTVELYSTPNIEHLPLGELFRSPLGRLASIGLHLVGFGFIAWQLRRRAAPLVDPFDQPTDEALIPAQDEGAYDEDAIEGGERGPVMAFLARLLEGRSIRRDRSALLISEGGGRLDRRDAALLLLIFVAALLLRSYRLEVPYSMHFDEVYHARTAVEFLQHWRYDKAHSIYEFTHPHLAKYAMAAGIAALGNNRVIDTRNLGLRISDAVSEERWAPPGRPGEHYGERLYVATGSELAIYDLINLSAPGANLPDEAVALAMDDGTHTLYLGRADGSISRIDTAEFDSLRMGGQTPAQTQPLAQVSDQSGDLVGLDIAGGRLIATLSDGTLVSLDPQTGFETGRATLSSPAAIVAVQARDEVIIDPVQAGDVGLVAQVLSGLLGEDDETRILDLIGPSADSVVVAGYVGAAADEIQTAIDDGRLSGVTVQDGGGLAVATTDGVELLDADSLVSLMSFPTDQPATGLAFADQGPDQPTIYVATGSTLMTIRMPADQVPAVDQRVTMPNDVESAIWNPATTMVHVLGTSQDGLAPTIYVFEPRSNSVFADARLDFKPSALVLDVAPDYPAEDRDDLLALEPGGQLAIVDVGGNQFAYRFPGVLLGALMAALIYLLARFLFRRRGIAMIAGLLVLADGMFFANARIAMNDSYVAFFIVAAMTVFVPLWLGRWRGRLVTAGGLATVGVLLGLALASKWVGAYAIGAVILLVLLRSALGRLVALAGMIGLTAVLGYIAVTPAAGAENPQLNYIFLILMVALTTLLAIAITIRPVRLTREEVRLAVLGQLVAGALGLAAGLTIVASTRLTLVGGALIAGGLVVAALVWLGGRRGLGPYSAVPSATTDELVASPPPPSGWLRPGAGFLGLPWVLALAALVVLPLLVYLVSYVPWIELGNRWTDAFPAGNAGQTFLDLQRSMYDYHNNLRATHPASSPWWAWPLDLKPVWFEQQSYAGNTTAVIYDTGNLVIFWLSIPAAAFVAWKAWRRRSLALTFVALAIASLWLPWARIDRATFQYHIFTTLPFSFIALAYFLSELWHGPGRRTWMVARVAAALAIIGAPLLWLLRLPLCGIAHTEAVNSGTEACAGLSRQLALTDLQMLGLLLALGGLAAAGVAIYTRLRDGDSASRLAAGPRTIGSLVLPVSFSIGLLGLAIIVLGAGVSGAPAFQMDVNAEGPAFVALLLLAVPAYFVLRATDPRRFVIGTLAAVVIWFVAFYPNIGSLPVPNALAQIHLGLLPTWNWGFQFAVNLDEPNRAGIDWAAVGLLAVVVVGLCVAAAFAARNWYAARYLEDDVSVPPEVSAPPETS